MNSMKCIKIDISKYERNNTSIKKKNRKTNIGNKERQSSLEIPLTCPQNKRSTRVITASSLLIILMQKSNK